MQNTQTISPATDQATHDETRAPRVNYVRVAPEAFRGQRGMENYILQCGLEHSLLHLVKLRASYINGCAYCVDMHTKDARRDGETEHRLYAVPVWRETPFFTPRERAALAWTEAITEIGREGVSDEVYDSARAHFDEAELVRPTMA